MKAAELILVAIDFETTGTVPGYPDEPWQVGLVSIRDGQPQKTSLSERYFRVAADRPFNPCAPGSWRMKREQLASAPLLSASLPMLRDQVLGVPLVAHNAATERKVFRSAWPLQRPGPWIDTLKLSRLAFSGLPSYELQAVVRHIGGENDVAALVPDREPHDALYDAAASAVLLCYLLKQPGWSGLTVDDLARPAHRSRSVKKS